MFFVQQVVYQDWFCVPVPWCTEDTPGQVRMSHLSQCVVGSQGAHTTAVVSFHNTQAIQCQQLWRGTLLVCADRGLSVRQCGFYEISRPVTIGEPVNSQQWLHTILYAAEG